MNTSSLQQQFPLSSRKFWKKMMEAALIYLFLSFIIAFVAVLVWTSTLDPHYSHPTADSLTIPLMIGGGVIVFLITIFLYGVYVKAYIRNYYYSADNDFITIKKGVFTPTEIHVQYQKIQDVYVDQDIDDRMLGLYDVHIASATIGSAIEAHIDGVSKENAEGLKNTLMNSIRNVGQVPATNSVSAPQAPLQSQPVQINLTEDFSSNTYPITTRWFYSNIFQTLFSSFWTALLIMVFLFSPGKHSNQSLAQTFGYDFGLLNDFYIALGLALVLGFFHVIYLIIWKNNYRFEFTQEYIFTHEGVIGTKEAHTPYGTIQDVIVQQGFFDRLFGLYKVMIQNAAGNSMPQYSRRGAPAFQGIIIPGQTKDKANKLADFLKSTVLVKNTGRTGL